MPLAFFLLEEVLLRLNAKLPVFLTTTLPPISSENTVVWRYVSFLVFTL